ncbi:MAG: beta-ketoacyl-ACP synthase II [Chlamydiota bacterium]
MKKKQVVITGTGLVSCFGSDPKKFYEQLLLGKSGVKTITGFDASSQPTTFAAEVSGFSVDGYMEKKQARRADAFIHYAMVAGKNAFQDARLENVTPQRIGAIIGSGMGGMQAFYDGSIAVRDHGYRRLTPFFVPSIVTNMAGGMLAIECGFFGPNYSISTACATGNNCLLAALETIQLGKADVMLAGSSEAAINPIGMAGFMSMRALSTSNAAPEKASKPWDQARDGFVMGEGAGVLVLEEKEHAEKRGATIYAEFLGGSANGDAYHITQPRPGGEVVMECMKSALESAHIHPEDVNYINAHATSTPVGDLCELRAIRELFKGNANHILINSTKSMIGHCLGAAGSLEAIATIMAMRTNQIHPTLNLEHPDEEVADLNLCMGKKRSHVVSAALSNSFGFGGNNCCLVFAPYVA